MSAAESILSREAAWREAIEKLEAIRSDVAAKEAVVDELQRVIQDNQDQADEWQDEERQLGKQESENIQRLSAAQRQVDRARQQETFIERQRERREREIIRLRERITNLETTINNGREILQTHEVARVEAESKLGSLPVVESQQQQGSIEQKITSAETIVAGRLAVVDYKTGKVESQKGVQESLQLSIYALACRDALGLGTPDNVTLYFTEAATRMSTTRTDEQLDAARDELAAWVGRVRAGDFAATPSRARTTTACPPWAR